MIHMIKYTARDHRILTILSVSAEDESDSPPQNHRLGEKSIWEIDPLSDFSVVTSHISKLFSPNHEGAETSFLLLNESWKLIISHDFRSSGSKRNNKYCHSHDKTIQLVTVLRFWGLKCYLQQQVMQTDF